MSKWPTVMIGDVTRIVGGGTPKRSNPSYYNGPIPWVTPKDMKRWYIHDSQIRITESGLEHSTARLIPANSVLVVVRSGVLKHTVPVAINRSPVAINQDMKALICDDSIDADYLARFIKERSREILQWVRATTADNFPTENLKRLHVPLPPLKEQRHIAQVLDNVDNLRTRRREASTLLKELAQSIFLEMFGRDKSPLISPLGEHLSFITSGGRGWAKYYSSHGTRFIRSLDVRMNEIDDRDPVFVSAPQNAEAERTRVREGDVLLSLSG